jgi:hypothetical protein
VFSSIRIEDNVVYLANTGTMVVMDSDKTRKARPGLSDSPRATSPAAAARVVRRV